MQKTYPVLVLGVIVIVIVSLLAITMEIARTSVSGAVATSTPQSAICDSDGFVCPDGTVVGRVGPRCDFAACPVASAPETLVATIGQTVTGRSLTITPLEVIDDSRCPTDVQCIWAGTVRVLVRIVSGLGTSEMELELGEAVTTEAEEITLTDVLPGKAAGEPLPQSSYSLTFEIKNR